MKFSTIRRILQGLLVLSTRFGTSFANFSTFVAPVLLVSLASIVSPFSRLEGHVRLVRQERHSQQERFKELRLCRNSQRHHYLLSQAMPPSSSLFLATWSNGQAVQDYQNFLNSGKQKLEAADDTGSVILVLEGTTTRASTLLVNTLLQLGRINKKIDVVINYSHSEPLPNAINGQTEYPIYLAGIPPQHLQQFLANLPESYMQRIDDFVFFSGGLGFGNIEHILRERGYCRDQMTQVLISSIEVNQFGKIIDAKVSIGSDTNGDSKVAGECTACGKWAGSIARRLAGTGDASQENENYFDGNSGVVVQCRVDFYREWRRKMWERSVYDAVLHLVGAVRSSIKEDEQSSTTTIANVAQYYHEEVSDIVWEISHLLRGWKAITLLYGFEERILGLAELGPSVSEQPCVLLNDMFPYIWGNDVFLQSKTFLEYLHYAQQEKGMLSGINLPPQSTSNDYYAASSMRQGNLRADGVI